MSATTMPGFSLSAFTAKSVRSSRTGDLLCRVNVETPVKLNREQKDLLKKFQAAYEDDGTEHNPRSRTWLDGVREFFDRMTS